MAELGANAGGRCWYLLLLVSLLLDFTHPWAPGIFFFEGDQLYIDGAVTLGKTMPPRPTMAHQRESTLRVEDRARAVRQTALTRSETARRFTALPERRDLPSSTDRSAPPPSSPDAH